ncbi:MAG: DUF5937 family protein, partial [Mycobacteriales bacterium]
MIELHMSEQDVLRLRFAVSPIWEVLAAVRAVHLGTVPPSLRPWRALVEPVATPVLVALQASRRYTPDFLTPPPVAGERSIEAEIELVAQTPLDVVREECRRAGVPVDDPRALRDRVVEEMRDAWACLLQPHWPRLHRVLATDVDHRSRRLVSGGITSLLEDLHETVSWSAHALRVRGPVRDRRELHGEGVVLMPSVFGVGRPVVILDPPYQPVLIYPARGVATAFTAPVAPA